MSAMNRPMTDEEKEIIAAHYKQKMLDLQLKIEELSGNTTEQAVPKKEQTLTIAKPQEPIDVNIINVQGFVKTAMREATSKLITRDFKDLIIKRWPSLASMEDKELIRRLSSALSVAVKASKGEFVSAENPANPNSKLYGRKELFK